MLSSFQFSVSLCSKKKIDGHLSSKKDKFYSSRAQTVVPKND